MLNNMDKRAVWGLVLGLVLGTVGFFFFDRLIFSVLLGTFVVALVAGLKSWKEGAKIGGLTGVLLLVIYVVLFQFAGMDGLASVSFAFLDHVLYLLTFGGVGCALIGAVVGAVVSLVNQR